MNGTKVEVTAEDLQHLREWIDKKPHVPSHYDDAFLTAFIVGCKGSLQRTKLVLDNFSGLCSRYPDMYGNLNILRPKMSAYLSAAVQYPLPKKLEGDITVFICGISANIVDPYDFDVIDYFPYSLATMLVQLKENDLGSGKMMMVINGGNVSLTHMRSMTPTIIKNWLEVLNSTVPSRLNGIHTFNMPVFMEWVFNLIKTLVKAKIAQRIFMHNSIEGVYQHVPRDMLPSDFGGKEEPSQVGHERWRKKMEGYNDMFMREEKLMKEANEHRPKTKDDEDMAGTFKKLTVD